MTCSADNAGSQQETRPARAKTCRSCGKKFRPFSSLAIACSPACALKAARQERERKERRENAVAREMVKSRRELMADVQHAFNALVRARDSGKPCVSCGHPDDGRRQRHAGHYRSVGAHPALRFELANVHAQCSICNNHLSGNLVAYRAELIRRVGTETVEWLEGPHDAKKYSFDELREMKIRFRKMARQASSVGQVGR